jgi:hypothetical protein
LATVLCAASMEAQRLSEGGLREKLSVTTTRLEAAEQLLVEARTGMHEQDARIRESEQRVLEKPLEAQVTDLEKDLASARVGHVEAEVARTLGAEQTTTLAESLQISAWSSTRVLPWSSGLSPRPANSIGCVIHCPRSRQREFQSQ